jgi:2-phosphosulfolactate phosphatase
LYAHQPERCRLDWGRHGARQAAERGDVLVMVDTLRCSTAVATAVHHGGLIYPRSPDEDAAALARQSDGRLEPFDPMPTRPQAQP